MSRYGTLFTGSTDTVDTPVPAKAAYRLLLVDDEENVLRALQRVFRQENYQIDTAANGHAAIEQLRGQAYQLMICDYLMPGMTGGELLKRAKDMQPDMIRIMLTGQADTGAVLAAIKEGAVYKFILKPWNDDDLRITVALALEQYELVQRNKLLQQDIAKKQKEIAALAKMTVSNRSQLAIMLAKRGLLSERQVQELHRLQLNKREPIMQLLLEKGWVAEATIHEVLRKDLLIEQVDLAEMHIDPLLVELIPRAFCERQLVMPLKLEGKRLLLAMADPLDMGMIDDMRFVSGLDVVPVLAGIREIRQKIVATYVQEEADVSFEDLQTLVGGAELYEGIEIVIEEDEVASLEDLLHATEEPPAIRLVNVIVLEAIRLGASDIHIHPRTKNVVVRYRIDGILIDKIHIPHNLHQSMVSRLKIMSELDISERRRPQDGRITVKAPNRIVDLRISTLPTINGEKVVMRILDRNNTVVGIQELGLSDSDLDKVKLLVEKPQGIVLATGPTGSGKTTTLYSMLQTSATPTKNYVTIEDPVEYYMDMAGQVLIKERIGLTFPLVLRAILRQDPDVIMLGEIRDLDTAEVAFHAAMTGHLVYSTLHTNSAIATISRLLDLGLKAHVIATALEGIIAQRLVRRICSYCAQRVPIDPVTYRKLGQAFAKAPEIASRGGGCTRCHQTGYQGRVGLYEVLVPDDTLRHLIAGGANPAEISRYARSLEAGSLLEDGYRKVVAGHTTADEVLRVLGPCS
ncbi:ATPase, T2SS/T4P/T4SS family [Chitinivorax sp. B]|uniref:ATPase, T2SS/T4P/T4SS family n=1 Tax=Chitinivorax sp. B TaxID=2502235 RepID=UPI0010F4377E|nr:ATPase, T2SS/T4P/T4SS family [Chitinivorax sp. B]